MEINILECDFKNNEHRNKIVELTEAFLLDPISGSKTLSTEVRENLVPCLENHPGILILFALVNNQYVGLCICYTNISSFKAKPYFNVHDVSVLEPFRGKGIGRKLLERVADIAVQRGYCKITLEVHETNLRAQALYSNLGFKDDSPRLLYWTKDLLQKSN
jgi:ribosomal protein S18 acetylase RimI-like enzyme